MPQQLYLYVSLLPLDDREEVEYFVCLPLTRFYAATLLQYAESFRVHTDIVWDVRLREEIAFPDDLRIAVYGAGSVAIPDGDSAVVSSLPPNDSLVDGGTSVLANLDADSVYWEISGEDAWLGGRTVEVPYTFFRTFLDGSKPTVPVEHTW